jgi:hypothetical protein
VRTNELTDDEQTITGALADLNKNRWAGAGMKMRLATLEAAPSPRKGARRAIAFPGFSA